MTPLSLVEKMDDILVESNLFIGMQDEVTLEQNAQGQMVFKVPHKGIGILTERSSLEEMELVWHGVAGSWMDSHQHSFSSERLELVSGALHIWWQAGGGIKKAVLDTPGDTIVIPAGVPHYAYYPVETKVLLSWTPPLDSIVVGGGDG